MIKSEWLVYVSSSQNNERIRYHQKKQRDDKNLKLEKKADR